MDPKQLERRLRLAVYGTCIVLWPMAVYLVVTEQYHYFSGAKSVLYFTVALLWATGGSAFLFWKHRRDVACRRFEALERAMKRHPAGSKAYA